MSLFYQSEHGEILARTCYPPTVRGVHQSFLPCLSFWASLFFFYQNSHLSSISHFLLQKLNIKSFGSFPFMPLQLSRLMLFAPQDARAIFLPYDFWIFFVLCYWGRIQKPLYAEPHLQTDKQRRRRDVDK